MVAKVSKLAAGECTDYLDSLKLEPERGCTKLKFQFFENFLKKNSLWIIARKLLIIYTLNFTLSFVLSESDFLII